MASVTWIGEGDPKAEVTMRGKTFKAGEAVDIDEKQYPDLVEKCSSNPMFKVEGYGGGTPESDPELHPAPSTVSAQYPVPKPGEPVKPTGAKGSK